MKTPHEILSKVQAASVLVIDDNPFMRTLIRGILAHIGVKAIHDAADGITGLELVRTLAPTLVLVDWEMPMLTGAEFVRTVRSPATFPLPDVPIIMVTGHGERWRVLQALQLGVNEFLVKPVSANSMLERMVSIVANPRPIVQLGSYYGPQPRRGIEELVKSAPVVLAPVPAQSPAAAMAT
jgi:two-component system chemotaxis response regulator CheY